MELASAAELIAVHIQRLINTGLLHRLYEGLMQRCNAYANVFFVKMAVYRRCDFRPGNMVNHTIASQYINFLLFERFVNFDLAGTLSLPELSLLKL